MSESLGLLSFLYNMKFDDNMRLNFVSNPKDLMKEFGLKKEEKYAIMSALNGKYEEIGELMQNIIKEELKFPSSMLDQLMKNTTDLT
ncbi:MAG: hypothetical protein QG641_959 [Candidatus Poribacteria bacterium]|nr:hypothetical protein [Candidatus Poribacteria bacterium]